MGVSLSGDFKGLRALKKEGILGTIRASRTVIEGRDVPIKLVSRVSSVALSLSCSWSSRIIGPFTLP